MNNKKIKITFKEDEYTGSVTFKTPKTNYQGLELLNLPLERIIDDWENEELQENILETENCKLSITEGDDDWYFIMILGEGENTLKFDDLSRNLAYYVVKIELIEEEKNNG